jgi:hypothetical protein
MSKEFDPLHRWLGIPPEEQPPNHYRLLGLKTFESSADVIESAADQRMAYVRQSATGKHAALSQEVLNALATARVCLLNPNDKAAYDKTLRAKLKAAEPKPSRALRAAPLKPAQPATPRNPAPAIASKPGNAASAIVPTIRVSAPAKRERHGSALPWIAAGACGLIAVAAAAFVAVKMLPGKPEAVAVAANDSAAEQSVPETSSPPPTAVDSKAAPPTASDPPATNVESPEVPLAEEPPLAPVATAESPASPEERPCDPPAATLPATTPETPPASADADVGSKAGPSDEAPMPDERSLADLINAQPPTNLADSNLTGQAPGSPAGAEPMRVAVPDDAQLQAAEAAMQEAFGDELKKALDPLEHRALVDKLLRTGRDSPGEPATQYVVLREAHDRAVALRDGKLALDIVDELAKRFEIDGPAAKLEALGKLVRAARDGPTHVSLARAGLDLAADFFDADRFDDATKVSSMASTSAGRGQHAYFKALALNQEKQAKLLGRAFSLLESERSTLAANPTDAAANLALGRFYCFLKRDLRRGLPYLQRGNDPQLSRLAALELDPKSRESNAQQLADGWWDVADTLERDEQPAARLQAKRWYLVVRPKLQGLALREVDSRLKQVPSPRVQLRVRIEELDGVDEIHFLSDELLWRHKHWELPKGVIVNDLAWDVRNSPTLPNRGSTLLLPPDVDFSTIQAQKVSGRAQIKAEGFPDRAVVIVDDVWAGQKNCELLVTFGGTVR